MSWCETHGVDYVLGLAKNSRLKAAIAAEMAEANAHYEALLQAARVFRDFRYRTRKSWSCERRVIGKAEHLAKGENPRFVVTSLSTKDLDARALYEDLYCARGDRQKIVSRNSSWRCSLTARQHMRCVPISCACIFPRSLMC